MWDKVLTLAACALAAALIAGAVIGFVRKPAPHDAVALPAVQAEVPATVAGVEATRTSNVAAEVRAPAQARPTKTKPAAAATPLPRTSCAALRGVHDRTRQERQWYIDNCLFLAKRAAAQATRPPLADLLAANGLGVSAAGNGRSASSATPPPWLTDRVAVVEAVSWMESRAPLALSADDETCVPIWLNGHWVVTCRVHLLGCDGPQCAASLSLCVFDTEPMIVTDPEC